MIFLDCRRSRAGRRRSTISCSTVIGAINGYGPGLLTSPVMNTFRLLICLDDHRDVRIFEVLLRLFDEQIVQLAGRQSGRTHFVQQRQRDLAVGPHRDLRRHVLVAPEHDRQHVFGANQIVRNGGEHRRRNRRRRSRGDDAGGRLGVGPR